ncbi:hypothetical protein [Mesorhizobium sp.]|nr:hypothetical protein [Mesorhizobium sp.]RWM07977.1 MAG: transposase domain-containing protein [Mesorhizobium sp.]
MKGWSSRAQSALEPLGFLADVLARIVNGHLNSQIDESCPGYLALSRA